MAREERGFETLKRGGETPACMQTGRERWIACRFLTARKKGGGNRIWLLDGRNGKDSLAA